MEAVAQNADEAFELEGDFQNAVSRFVLLVGRDRSAAFAEYERVILEISAIEKRRSALIRQRQALLGSAR